MICLTKEIKLKCPCCDEGLILTVKDSELEISTGQENEIELSEVLNDLNIEFG